MNEMRMSHSGVRAQAFLLGVDTQLQFARAWAVAVAAYGCDVVRPLLLRESPCCQLSSVDGYTVVASSDDGFRGISPCSPRGP